MNTRCFYYLTLILLILALSSTGIVSAYSLTLDAPAEIRVGQSFVVTGTTNIPPPDKVDVVFSQSINIPVEVARQSIQITEKGDTSFNITFETTGLEKGNYKIEAISQTQRDFSGGSRNLRVLKLTDRSDIIRFSSPLYQEFDGNLLIEARIQGYEDNSIQMEIKKGNNSVFGPESVPVTKGLVKYEMPIKEQGAYSVIFNDYKGYIGTYSIQIGEETKEPSQEPSPTGTTQEPVSLTEIPTQNPVDESTNKPSNLSTQEPVVDGTKVPPTQKSVPDVTVSETLSNPGSEISSTAQVSRDSPGYFVVSVQKSPIIIKTSANADWVLEYKTSPDAASVKINDKMKEASEEASISTDSKKIYVKVYPYNYKSGQEVTLSASNADAITLSDEAALSFGAPPRYGSQSQSGTGKSPAPLAGILLGIIGAAWVIRRKER
ncbi:MAG: hypothetical protein V1862_04425 [Methanobacteriota archaeon]